MKTWFVLAFAALGACIDVPDSAEDPEMLETSEEVSELTTPVNTGLGFIYSQYGNLYVTGLKGYAYCEDGIAAPSCLIDRVDFSLMPHLTHDQITELYTRFSLTTSDRATTSVVATGQWRTVTVTDSRYDPPRSYRRIDLQLLTVHRSQPVTPHGRDFYRLSGSTAQRAQLVSGGKTLPFWATIEFPGPVISNSYGVVSDGFVTATVVQPPSVPIQLVADAYFQRM